MKKKLLLYVFSIVIISSLAICTFIWTYTHRATEAIVEKIKRNSQSQLQHKFVTFNKLLKDSTAQFDLDVVDILDDIHEEILSEGGDFGIISGAVFDELKERHNVDNIYLINERGIIENSSDGDFNHFNLFNVSPQLRQELSSIIGTGEVRTFGVSFDREGKLKKSSYYGPYDKNYIIEVSVDIKELIKTSQSPEYVDYLFSSFFRELSEASDFVTDVDVFTLSSGNHLSLFNPKLPTSVELLVDLSKQKPNIEVYEDHICHSYTLLTEGSTSMPIDMEETICTKISYDFSSLDSFLSNVVVTPLIIVCGVIVVTLLMLSRFLNRFLIYRILKINEGLQEIAGNISCQPLEIDGQDELARIVDNINSMKLKLMERETELIESKVLLEDRVEMRTGELASANKELTQEIREREKAEQVAEDHRRQLLHDDKLKTLGVLVAGMAHEINNPNNFIMLNAPILEKGWNDARNVLERHQDELDQEYFAGMDYEDFADAVPKLFDGIKSGAVRIEEIVASLKGYSHADSGQLAAFSVNQAVQDALPLLANMIKRSTSYFSVDYAEQLPDTFGDIRRIEQVIINLVQNSSQALTDRNKAIKIRTYHDEKNAEVVIEVTDEGKGIPDSDLVSVLDPFFTTKRDCGGTGLGLSISAGIMQEHNGKLVFESKLGSGTTARMILPIRTENLEG